MNHLLTTHDLAEVDLLNICRNAEGCDGVLKSQDLRGVPYTVLEGKVMATLFFEPSTRTRLSFESAMVRMGGQVISVAERNSTSDAKGEHFLDTIQTVAQYADVIIARTPDPISEDVKNQFRQLPCTYINAGDGKNEHPTQALLDYYTIRKYKGVMDQHKICIVGDLQNSRTINSFVEVMGRYPGNVIFTYNSVDNSKELPRNREPLAPIHHLEDEDQFNHFLSEYDVIYLNRVQRERHESDEVLCQFQLKRSHLESLKRDALVLNPGPRLKELPRDLDFDHRIKFFEQARNGMLVRMSILHHFLTHSSQSS